MTLSRSAASRGVHQFCRLGSSRESAVKQCDDAMRCDWRRRWETARAIFFWNSIGSEREGSAFCPLENDRELRKAYRQLIRHNTSRRSALIQKDRPSAVPEVHYLARFQPHSSASGC